MFGPVPQGTGFFCPHAPARSPFALFLLRLRKPITPHGFAWVQRGAVSLKEENMEEKTGFMGSSGAAGSRTSGSWKKRKSDYAGEAEISELGNRLCDHYGKLLGELRKSVSAMREADTAMRKSLAAYYEGVFRVYREMRMSHVHRHGCFSCLRLKLNSPRGDVVDPPHWQVILFMKGNCRLEYGLIINHQTGRCSAGRAGSRLMPWEKTYLGVIESFLADTRVFRQRMSSISRLTKSASKHIEDMERLLARLRCFSNGFEGIGTGMKMIHHGTALTPAGIRREMSSAGCSASRSPTLTLMLEES